SKRATALKSKPANARRNASRLRRMVSHERPDWKPSRLSFSNRRTSSATGNPHSRSWYSRYSGVESPHEQRHTPSSPRMIPSLMTESMAADEVLARRARRRRRSTQSLASQTRHAPVQQTDRARFGLRGPDRPYLAGVRRRGRGGIRFGGRDRG